VPALSARSRGHQPPGTAVSRGDDRSAVGIQRATDARERKVTFVKLSPYNAVTVWIWQKAYRILEDLPE